MRINIVLDDDLVERAFRLSKVKTKKDLIDEALRELVRVRAPLPLTDLMGKVRFAKGYDYKKLRAGR
jgi:Arc/MetJ family transcription regulator